MLLVTEGELVLDSEDDALTLARGQAAFAFPGDDLRVSGAGVAFLAGPGSG